MTGDIKRHATTQELIDWCVEELNKYDMVVLMTEKKNWWRREFWRGHNALVCSILDTYLTREEIKKRLTTEAYERYYGRL